MSLTSVSYFAGERLDAVEMEESVEQTLISALLMPEIGQGATEAGEVYLPVDQVVRLLQDIPELSLYRGELGVVVSVWCSPIVAYEVEFFRPDEECSTRVLVFARHLQAEPSVEVEGYS